VNTLKQARFSRIRRHEIHPLSYNFAFVKINRPIFIFEQKLLIFSKIFSVLTLDLPVFKFLKKLYPFLSYRQNPKFLDFSKVRFVIKQAHDSQKLRLFTPALYPYHCSIFLLSILLPILAAYFRSHSLNPAPLIPLPKSRSLNPAP